MHESVLSWAAKEVAIREISELRTLEVGSCDVNGTVRQFFKGDYVGVDRDEGPGVDQQVVPGEPLPFDDDSFDVVISTEMLEHDMRPWKTVCEMARVLKPGGTMLLTARGYDERGAFHVHNPPDYWRYSGDALGVLALDAGLVNISVYRDPQVPGFFLAGVKP